MNCTLHHILTSRSNKSSQVFPLQRPGGCRLHTVTVVLTPCSTYILKGRILGRTGRGTGGCVRTVAVLDLGAVVCAACELCSTWLLAAVRQFQCRLLTTRVPLQSDKARS